MALRLSYGFPILFKAFLLVPIFFVKGFVCGFLYSIFYILVKSLSIGVAIGGKAAISPMTTGKRGFSKSPF